MSTFVPLVYSGPDDEAIHCHTDNTNCCDNEYSEDGLNMQQGWYSPNGDKILCQYEIYNESYILNEGFFTSSSQSVIRLFASSRSTAYGMYCCWILDKNGSSHTMCINIGMKTSN